MIKQLILFFCFVSSIHALRIGIVYDGPIEFKNPFYQEVREEITSLLSEEGDVKLHQFYGNWTLRGSMIALEEALNADLDAVVTLGIMASNEALTVDSPPCPLVIGFDISLFEGRPTSDQTAYFKGKSFLLDELSLFKNLTHAKSYAIVGDESYIDNPKFPEIQQKIGTVMRSMHTEPKFIPMLSDPEDAIGVLEDIEVEAVIFLPTPRLGKWGFGAFLEVVNDMHLPSFTFGGEEQVEEGVLMTTTPKSEMRRIARRIALNVQELYLNHTNADIEVKFNRKEEMIINETTAAEIGLELPYKYVAQAKLIHKALPPPDQLLDLRESLELSIADNLDINVERYVVESGRQEVLKDFAELLPQLNSSALARIINANTAKYGRGIEPQNNIRGSLVLDQMVYDDSKIARYQVEKKLQKAREFNLQTVELDILLDTSVSYLLILRVQAEKEIAFENLNLTKVNLKHAHELVDSGQARLSEVYRWESALSTNREQLVSIQATLDNTKAQFNRLLNRSWEEHVNVDDIAALQTNLSYGLQDLGYVITAPSKYERYKEFLINLALKNSPEIKSLDEQIDAQARRLTESERAFYLPKFSGFAELNGNLAKSGHGSEPVPTLSNSIPEKKIGLKMTFPLFTSGRRTAQMNQSVANLLRVKTEKASVETKVEERVLKAVDNLKSSFEGIFLADAAAVAGEKNLVIVSNNYARGAVSIVDLIDAQNTAIVAKTNYSNALYDYLIDYMNLQRNIAEFDQFLAKSDIDAKRKELIRYIEGEDNENS
ncbi:MAG: hypothetical protein SP1CHLAM54_13590 [Chlamydiia bacterium]|nr:hypothetical protein [Chlamydiia bacterium]MCH9616252.1 hypothetical protein [Chlamydiia bacterium]MCH9629762.1 hypothetical protein [Chlamydiia bacterium]